MILVSHDRDFLQGLTDQVFEFRDHKIKEYLGDIEYFLQERNLRSMREAEKRSVVLVAKTASTASKKSYEEQKQLKSLKNKLSKVESQISALEKAIKESDVALEVNYDETVKDPSFFDGYQAKKDELEQLMQRWEDISEAIDQLN